MKISTIVEFLLNSILQSLEIVRMIPTSGYVSLWENRRKCLVSNHGWESMPVTILKF